jgi:ABC-type amino acid transport substrate-binding protein
MRAVSVHGPGQQRPRQTSPRRCAGLWRPVRALVLGLASLGLAGGAHAELLSGPQRAWVAGQGAWRMAPEKDYGPFVFTDPQGRVQGLSIDTLNLVAQRTGLRFETLPARPLAEQLAAARRGEVDVLTSLRPTAERSAYLLFTTPYASVPAVVVSRDLGLGALAALAGHRVAVGQGYAVEAYVRARYPMVRWVAVPSDLEALRGVTSREFDAAVADLASVAFLQKQQHLTGLQIGDSVGFEYALSFAVRKDLPRLREVLDAGVQALDADDRRRLRERWLQPGSTIAPRRPALWLALAAMVLGGVLLLRGASRWRGQRRRGPTA